MFIFLTHDIAIPLFPGFSSRRRRASLFPSSPKEKGLASHRSKRGKEKPLVSPISSFVFRTFFSFFLPLKYVHVVRRDEASLEGTACIIHERNFPIFKKFPVRLHRQAVKRREWLPFIKAKIAPTGPMVSYRHASCSLAEFSCLFLAVFTTVSVSLKGQGMGSGPRLINDRQTRPEFSRLQGRQRWCSW